MIQGKKLHIYCSGFLETDLELISQFQWEDSLEKAVHQCHLESLISEQPLFRSQGDLSFELFSQETGLCVNLVVLEARWS